LAENEWDPKRGCSVARAIYSFGRANQLDADQLRLLAASILRVVSGDEAPTGASVAAAGAGDVRIVESRAKLLCGVVSVAWTALRGGRWRRDHGTRST